MDLRIWACFFKTCVLLVFGRFKLNLACFCRFLFADCFFSNLMTLLLFQFTAKQNLGVFLCNLAHLGLFFRICLPSFIFNLPAGFIFFEFSYQTQVGLVFSVKLPVLGLLFKFACLFLQINWHHCFTVYSEV